MARAAALLLALSAAWAATKEDDRVTSIPGFEAQFEKGLGFDVYSGYLDVQVPKASTGYDSLSIHYELHTCRAKDCPLALWHQGGPGGSAVFGAWTEMGPFQLMAQGPVYNEKNAWNNAAHMLYLESRRPAPRSRAPRRATRRAPSTVKNRARMQVDGCHSGGGLRAHDRGLPREVPGVQVRELYLTGESLRRASTCQISPTTCCSRRIVSRSQD